jgi:hypothetical protein
MDLDEQCAAAGGSEVKRRPARAASIAREPRLRPRRVGALAPALG